MTESKNYEIKRVNKTLLISWLTIIIILLVAYSIEVLKGERTIGYIVLFGVVMLIPFLMTVLLYQYKKDWEKMGYFIVVGYSIMYGFVMFTGSTQMVFSYVFPLLCFLVLYHKRSLIVFSFVITMLINVSSLFYQLEQDSITISNSKDVEIRFATLIVSFAGGFVSARLYNSIHNDNQKYTKELSHKNQEIQEMAIQTIATIANTIDAKDEYTKGHSKRVAEYSVAIAKEIGMSDERMNELRSIALLHDIGKIGVPDSVLNKPGKLTNSEYELMKQHTTIGADILKDIKMFPGIDVGAKYHHERYDGKGYPENKVGTDIPEIARIIAVADAFDAMTSNRVYRKQLDLEYVIEELKRCSGSQFDPEMAKVLIRMLEEKRLSPIVLQESENISDVSKIWSRVIEKDERKYKEKSVSDELTGLLNRNYGEKLIRESVESNRGTLIIFDVDHFRKINGESGFLLGDIILCCLSRCLEVIEQKKIVSRYGGDEFVMFLPDITEEKYIKELLDNLYLEIKKQHDTGKELVRFTVSAGVSICKELKNSYQVCFLDADRALYMSKRNGGNCYTFYEKNLVGDGTKNDKNADLIYFQDFIQNPEKNEQYFDGVSQEIKQGVDLVKGLIEKEECPLQVVLFTANNNEGRHISLEKQQEVMQYLETAIARSIKGKDYIVKFSNTQRMIILTKAGDDGMRSVTTHIMKEFYKLYDNKEINVSYDTIEFI